MKEEFCGCFTIDYQYVVNNRQELTEQTKQNLIELVKKTNEATGNKGSDYKNADTNANNINICKGRSKITETELASSWMVWLHTGEPMILEFADSGLLTILELILGKDTIKPVDGTIISFHYARNLDRFKCPDDLIVFDFQDVDFIDVKENENE